MPKVDFSGVNTEFSPLPAGTYEATLTKWQLKKSNNGNDMVVLEFTVSEGDYTGRKLWINRSLLPQSLFGLKRDLLALGVDSEDLEGTVEIESMLTDCIDETARLDVSIREYEGRESNQIDAVRAPSLA